MPLLAQVPQIPASVFRSPRHRWQPLVPSYRRVPGLDHQASSTAVEHSVKRNPSAAPMHDAVPRCRMGTAGIAGSEHTEMQYFNCSPIYLPLPLISLYFLLTFC